VGGPRKIHRGCGATDASSSRYQPRYKPPVAESERRKFSDELPAQRCGAIYIPICLRPVEGPFYRTLKFVPRVLLLPSILRRPGCILGGGLQHVVSRRKVLLRRKSSTNALRDQYKTRPAKSLLMGQRPSILAQP